MKKVLQLIMKRNYSWVLKVAALLSAGILYFGLAAYSQSVNKDSLSLVAKIKVEKEKLSELQNSLARTAKEKEGEKKEVEKKEANRQGRLSADDGRSANESLDARADARYARKAAANRETLQKNIRKLTGKIARDQADLNKYIATENAYREAVRQEAARARGSN
jgi:hypothetical protein